MANEFANDRGRERPTNYIELCNTIADTYPFGGHHGVQKDAIQNSIDARKGRKPVTVDFEIIVNESGTFLTITDTNTTGLTGDVKQTEDYEHDLSPDDHWARFEAFAFTKSNPDAIGARGQGKFIFLYSSEEYKMYYDTLRDDGVYRVGKTQATKTRCPIYPGPSVEPWEGERGAAILNEETGLDPIDHVGTRVIIANPKRELLEELRSGEFVSAIQETWFRALEKKKVIIRVYVDGNIDDVQLPYLFPLPNRDSEDVLIWLLGRDFREYAISTGSSETYRVKQFHAAYFRNIEIPDDLQGIAVVHNNMKICSIQMDFAPLDKRGRITGFIEFDRTLDQELRKTANQYPNHYDLKWRRKIPHAIKEYINLQLEEFGRTKLGIGEDPRERKRRKQSEAEDWAIRQLMRHARDLDLWGSKGPKRPPVITPPVEPKPIGVSINNFSFPEPDIAPRVDWDSSFLGVYVTAYNRREPPSEVAINLLVCREDTTIQKLIDRNEQFLQTGKRIGYGPFDIPIVEEQFTEPGEYRLVASLFDVNTGDRIDRVSRRFWVEADPPLRRPFDLVPVPSFPSPHEFRQWRTSGSINSSATVYYNTSHPAYQEVEGSERQNDYLLEIILGAAIQFVLERPHNEEDEPDYHPLSAERILGTDPEIIPSKAYQELTRYMSEVRWRILE